MIYIHPILTAYGAMEDGSVWSRNNHGKGFREWRVLKPTVCSNYYTGITVLRNDGKRRRFLIHRFVWECIKGEIPKGLQINHLDKIRWNNAISNLELCTQSENLKHAAAARGEKNGQAQLNQEAANAIRFLHEHGWSRFNLARAFRISETTINHIVNFKLWNYTT